MQYRRPSQYISSVAGGIRVRNTELINNITSASAATSKTYAAIGSNFVNFPWLSALARNYSKFRVHALKIYLISSCPSTQRGNVALGWFSDLNDATYWFTSGTTEAIYQTRHNVSGPCWAGDGEHVVMTIPPSEFTRYTTNPYKRIGVAVNSDGYNQLMAGTIGFQLGSNGSGSSLSVGGLFVEYDIELVDSVPNGFDALSAQTCDPPYCIPPPVLIPDPVPDNN